MSTTAATEAVSASASERCEGTPTLTTMKARMAYLVEQLGLTHVQAHHMIRAWQRDQERPLVTAGASYDDDFLDWLMRQLPGGRPTRAVKKHDWAVRS